MGFELYWQHATHLVTTFKAIRTAKQNLNFIFSNEGEHLELWKRLYLLLPYVLFYTVEVVESLFALFVDEDPREDLVSMRRTVGFLLWSQQTSRRPDAEVDVQDRVDSELEDVHLPCPECGVEVLLNSANMMRFFRFSRIRCGRCREAYQVVDAPVPPGKCGSPA